MPIDLSALASDTATTEVTFAGSTAKITYRPTYVTQENLERLSDEEDGNLEFVVGAVTSWDIMMGKKRVPITQEAVKRLPLPLVRKVVLAVLAGKDESDTDDSGEEETGSFGG